MATLELVLVIKMMVPILSLIIAASATMIDEKSTAKDVYRLKDCSELDVGLVNALLNPSACQGFRWQCLNTLPDIHLLNGACKDRLSPEQVSRVHPVIFGELILVTPATIKSTSCQSASFHRFFNILPDDALTESYVTHCQKDDVWVQRIADICQDDPAWCQLFLNECGPAVTGFPPFFFRLLSTPIKAGLAEGVYAYLTPDQFAHFHSVPFGPEHIRALQPECFRKFPRPTALLQLSLTALNRISKEQAMNFGPEPADLDQIEDVMARRAFILAHPCTYLRAIIKRFRSGDIVSVISERCKPIWSSPDSPQAAFNDRKYRHTLATYMRV